MEESGYAMTNRVDVLRRGLAQWPRPNDPRMYDAPALRPIRFDPQRRARDRELRATIRTLTNFLERREHALGLRKRVRKDHDRQLFRLTVEAIVCNLGALRLLSKDRALAVPRQAKTMWRKWRYRNPVYGQHFLDAIDLMALASVGLIVVLTRGYRFPNGDKQHTTIAPTRAFFDRVPPTLCDWNSIGRETEAEVLILKASKDRSGDDAKIIEYRDTRQTGQLHREVERINESLEDAPFRMIDDSESPVDDDDGQPIDPSRRTVRRVFNNGSWLEGGRLFGGFWERMRREDRFRLLRICSAKHPDGEEIANVDFSQLFPRLAYLRANTRAPAEDLYGLIDVGKSRDGYKKLVNALLFARGRLLRWPEETLRLFPEGTKLRDVVSRIRKAHAPIAPLFGTGIGYSLMFQESCILIEALLTLHKQGITALPLHDSVLVARSEAEVAKQVMEGAFALVTGEAGGHLKIDIGHANQYPVVMWEDGSRLNATVARKSADRFGLVLEHTLSRTDPIFSTPRDDGRLHR